MKRRDVLRFIEEKHIKSIILYCSIFKHIIYKVSLHCILLLIMIIRVITINPNYHKSYNKPNMILVFIIIVYLDILFSHQFEHFYDQIRYF